MNRVFYLLTLSLVYSVPCSAGLHFGLGKAAASKSAEVIKKAASESAKIVSCSSVPGATTASVTSLASGGTSLDVKTGASNCTTGGCVGFTTTGANTFVASGVMTGIISVGAVCGLGGISSLPTSGSYTGSVVAQSGVGYVGKLSDGGYVRFYVSGISGNVATIAYDYPFANTLTVSIVFANSVAASGTIFSSPSSINCSNGTCSAAFVKGTQITLIQTPASGSNFVGWSSGGCSGTGNTCVITLNSNATVTGNFCLTHGQVSYTTFGTYSHTACTTNITAQVWGGGGGGAGASVGYAGGGGGGGGYGSQSIYAMIGESFSVVVGTGGTGGIGGMTQTQGTSGGTSSFGVVSATGGHFAWVGNGGVGGIGGSSAANINVSGGNGSSGDTNGHGGNGGAGGNGGNGGGGGDLNIYSLATNGVAPGGGGGGGGGGASASGADGKVVVTW